MSSILFHAPPFFTRTLSSSYDDVKTASKKWPGRSEDGPNPVAIEDVMTVTPRSTVSTPSLSSVSISPTPSDPILSASANKKKRARPKDTVVHAAGEKRRRESIAGLFVQLEHRAAFREPLAKTRRTILTEAIKRIDALSNELECARGDLAAIQGLRQREHLQHSREPNAELLQAAQRLANLQQANALLAGENKGLKQRHTNLELHYDALRKDYTDCQNENTRLKVRQDAIRRIVNEEPVP